MLRGRNQGLAGQRSTNPERWEGGSRLKIVGLDALPIYKRLVALFPGPVENTGRYLKRLHRLNRGLYIDNWKVYELNEEPNGVRRMFSIDSTCITALEMLGWRLFRGLDRAIFSFRGVKREGKK